jgi:hypothetical protein
LTGNPQVNAYTGLDFRDRGVVTTPAETWQRLTNAQQCATNKQLRVSRLRVQQILDGHSAPPWMVRMLARELHVDEHELRAQILEDWER